jgi:DNA-binding CsgD family transcriptional regulator
VGVYQDEPTTVLMTMTSTAVLPARPQPLHARELDVLALVAEGYSTREVARTLSYSERTIKNILQDLTTRFGLRNRTQAVAWALRNGLI